MWPKGGTLIGWDAPANQGSMIAAPVSQGTDRMPPVLEADRSLRPDWCPSFPPTPSYFSSRPHKRLESRLIVQQRKTEA